MNILIIEDDQEWIDIIKYSLIFELKDIEPKIEELITVSSTYKQSRDYLYNKTWKLVIADINLNKDDCQDKSGLTLIKKAATKKIPIIIISGLLTLTDQGKLNDDKNISLYLKKDIVKDQFYKNENDFIDIVKEILFENNDFSIYKYKLSYDDKLYISHILVKLANDSQIAIIDYFINLVKQLNLSIELEKELSNMWIEDAGRNSTNFINWIQDKSVCKNYVKRFEITILGNLINIMLKESGDKKLLSISQKHDLITDLETINNLENIPKEIHNQNTLRYDVFICHSSNDKQFIKDNIISKLKHNQITYWFDDEQIKPVDRITEKIDEGLKDSRYIIACLSKNIFQSGWARAEFGAAINAELSGRRKRLIVVTVDDIDHDGIEKISNLLVDKISCKCSSKVELDKLIEFLKGEG